MQTLFCKIGIVILTIVKLGLATETFVGELEDTKHSVRGKVYKSNSDDTILIIKEFYYDGKCEVQIGNSFW